MSTHIQHRMYRPALQERDPEVLVGREWLVTNGLGGYASGTPAGTCTRQYHGLLIAALPAPLGRFVMFNHLAEEIKLEDRKVIRLDADEVSARGLTLHAGNLVEFRLESSLPVWRYEIGPVQLEKRVLMPHLQNTVHINYRLLSAPGGLRLRLRPSFHFRPHEAPVNSDLEKSYSLTAIHERIEIRSEVAPPFQMLLTANRCNMVLDGRFREIHYRMERARGYEDTG
ncbi:MAG TPA: glycogen debranching enzyme N-terminal domain-containing protein, partial [Pirellulales bacterium]|nr:glycogen debranching enzyme N-terminal domain-containing protein [Pirellulales bacterium]